MTWWYIYGYEDITCIVPPTAHRDAAPSEAYGIAPDSNKPGCDSSSKLYLGAGLALADIKIF